MPKVKVDTSKFHWNHFGGTMIKEEYSPYKDNILYWVSESSRRQDWLKSDYERLQFFYFPELKEALKFNNIEQPDMIDTVPKRDYDYADPPWDKNDADAQLRIQDTRKVYIPAIKWCKEHYEYKYKTTYDLVEQIAKEISDIDLHNSLIPKLFAEVEEMFSDPYKHQHMTYSINRRIDDPLSTPHVWDLETTSAPAGIGATVKKAGSVIPKGGSGGGGGTGAGGGLNTGPGSTTGDSPTESNPVILKLGITAKSVYVATPEGDIIEGLTASNDARFKVFALGGVIQPITYQIAYLVSAEESQTSTTARIQFTRAFSDLSVDLNKMYASLAIKLSNPADSNNTSYVEFNLTTAVRLRITIDPNNLLGNGSLQTATLTVKVV